MKTPIALLLATLALASSLRAEELRRTEASPTTPALVSSAPAVAPVLFASSVRAGTKKPATRSGAELAGAWFTPVGRLVRLVNDGVTVRDSAGSRTALSIGREFSGTHTAARKNWTVKLATTW